MTTVSVSYVTLDGQRYGYLAGTFRRDLQLVEVGNIVAKRVESPHIDAEIISFKDGIKSDYLNAEGEYVADSWGLMPSSPNGSPPLTQLSMGRALAIQIAQTTNSPDVSRYLVTMNNTGYLFVAGVSDRTLLMFDGSAWHIQPAFLPFSGASALHVEGTDLLIGDDDSSGVYASSDYGATWSFVFNVQRAAAVGNASGVYAILPLIQNNTRYIIAIGDHSNTGTGWRAIGVRYNYFNDVHDYQQFALDEAFCRAAISTYEMLYIAGANIASAGGNITNLPGVADAQNSGTIYTYNGTLSRMAVMSDTFATSLCLFNGVLYAGCFNGQVRSVGNGTTEILRQLDPSQPIYGMVEFQGALWVAAYNSANTRMEVHRYDGSWSMPHYVVEANGGSGGLVVYRDALYVGGGTRGSMRRVYKVSTTALNPYGEIQTPFVVYGAPTLKKRFERTSVDHGPLLAGQGVRAWVDYTGGASGTPRLTNRRVGSTRTVLELDDDVRSTRMRTWWGFVNSASPQDMTAYSAATRALPAPDGRHVWSASLILTPFAGGLWPDGTADTRDAYKKLQDLEALRLDGGSFQMVEPWYDDTVTPKMPRRAERVTIDPQTDMSASLSNPGMSDADIRVDIRLLQSQGRVNVIDNSSFEQSPVGTLPAGWVSGGVGGTAADTSTAVAGVDGGKVARLVFNGTSLNWLFAQSVVITPGRWHTLSGYMRRAMSSGLATLRVVEGASVYGGIQIPAATDAAFVRYNTSFIIPLTSSGSVQVQFFGEATPGGTLYGDAFQLEEGVPVSDYKEQGQG